MKYYEFPKGLAKISMTFEDYDNEWHILKCARHNI